MKAFTLLGVSLILVAAITIATHMVAPTSSPVDANQSLQRPNIPPPGQELERARETVTFDILLPGYVPGSAELLNVIYTAPGLGQPDDAGYSTVDVWYALADGRRLHIWMSDRDDLEERGRAPHQDSRARLVELSNGTWYEVILRDREPDAIVLARSIGGINIEMDVQGDATELRRMAESFDVS